MRTLNGNSTTEIAKSHGTTPVNIIGIAWSTGSTLYYADKDIFGIPGKILDLTTINDVVSRNNKSSQTVSVTLDDSDGTIRQIMDTSDIHQAIATVYQCFTNLSFDDKFVIFKGKISSPISWTESDRSIKVDIVSDIEAKDVGFSHRDIDWPLCFGSVLNVPAAKARMAVTGRLEDNVSIVDPLINWQMLKLQEAWCEEQSLAFFYKEIVDLNTALCPNIEVVLYDYIDCISSINLTFSQYTSKYNMAQYERKRINDPSTTESEKKNARLLLSNLEGEVSAYEQGLNYLSQRRWLDVWYTQLIIERNKIKKEAIDRIATCVTNMNTIAAEYMKLQDEKCKEQKYIKNQVVITGLSEFSSDDIIINGLRWRGTRNGNVFTFLTPGIPLPRYTNVTVDAWTPPLNDCGNPAVYNGVSNFYIHDPTLQMKNMYCLVIAKNGSRHLVKVTDQEDTMCTFELISQGGQRPTHLLQTPVVFQYGGSQIIGTNPGGIPITTVNNTPTITLDNDVVLALQGSNISPEDFMYLLNLCKLRPSERNWGIYNFVTPTPRETFTIIGEDIAQILEVSPVPLASWFDPNTFMIQEMPSATNWIATSGTTVYETSNFNDIFVANILPSTIKAVMAYRTTDGNKSLTPVPSTYYTYNEAENLGPITVTSLKMKVPLSSIQSEQWEDQIYVTLDSSVGSNVVDILQWIIEHYTDKSIDSVSFAAVKSMQENYPANFALLKRTDVRRLIEDIAFQARCSIYEIDNTMFIKYLPSQTEPMATFTTSDVEFGTIELTTTQTEDIITRMDVTWRPDYLPDTIVNPLTLRYNIARFGLHQQSYDWFIYNNYDLVVKSATFWMTRLGNTWKQLRFKTFLTHCDLNCNDRVILDLPGISVAGEVQQVDFDTSTNTVSLEVWLPVRIGEIDPYQFAYPSSIDPDIVLSSSTDIAVEDDPLITEVTGQ